MSMTSTACVPSGDSTVYPFQRGPGRRWSCPWVDRLGRAGRRQGVHQESEGTYAHQSCHGQEDRSAVKTPDLNLLPIVVALYDELSVSRAARQLGMSQPAVSKALRRLRETFDDPLFVRGPSGIVPTPRAHAIVRAARPHLQHLQEDLLKGERFDPATSTRPIVLGLSDIAEMAFLPSILDHLRVHAPKCPVQHGHGAGRAARRGLWRRATSTSRPATFPRSRRETSVSGGSRSTGSPA